MKVSRRQAAWRLPLLAFAVLFSGKEPAAAQDAFVLRGDRIEVGGAPTWRAWNLPLGTVAVDSRGVVPNFVLKEHNACLDARQFPLDPEAEQRGESAPPARTFPGHPG